MYIYIDTHIYQIHKSNKVRCFQFQNIEEFKHEIKVIQFIAKCKSILYVKLINK